MDLEHLSCVDDDLPPAMSSLWEKMEKALSLLKNSLGIGLQNLPYPHLCVPNSTLLEYRQLEGIIAFPVLDSDQPMHCRAVLELVTMEEKRDFDLETEKGFQAADLGINLQPRLRPECFSRDQRAELTEIANVTRAVCQTHRLPLALTWIPCDYTWGAVDGISKSHVRLCNSGFLRTCELSIERTACYSDEEMQGFVNACEQLFLNTGQGAAGQACETCLPSFEPDVKEKHVSEYPLAHHARKYNWNAAVAIWLRGSDADYNYILEFFLPILMKESSEQQGLVRNLKLARRKTCKSLRMFSKEELLWERGSKVSKNNAKIEPAPNADGNMFTVCANNKDERYLKCGNGSMRL